MEANEEKRKLYRESIKDIEPERLVYIDESGIDMSICKNRGWGKEVRSCLAKRVGNIIREQIL